MAGRPDFSAAGTYGGGQTVAVNTRPELVEVDATQTTTISSGNVETTEIYSPTGAIFKVASMMLNVSAPGSAASGNHEMQLRPLDSFGALVGRSNYNSGIRWENSHWQAADSLSYPPDTSAAVNAVQSLMATENNPLVVKYQNNTDVSNSNNRNIRFIMNEESY